MALQGRRIKTQYHTSFQPKGEIRLTDRLFIIVFLIKKTTFVITETRTVHRFVTKQGRGKRLINSNLVPISQIYPSVTLFKKHTRDLKLGLFLNENHLTLIVFPFCGHRNTKILLKNTCEHMTRVPSTASKLESCPSATWRQVALANRLCLGLNARHIYFTLTTELAFSSRKDNHFLPTEVVQVYLFHVRRALTTETPLLSQYLSALGTQGTGRVLVFSRVILQRDIFR